MIKQVDLTQKIEDGMPVYPGDIETHLFQSRYLSENGYNDHRLEIGMHSGTHIDSPMHLTDSKEFIGEVSIDNFTATGCILDVRNQYMIKVQKGYEELIIDNSIVLLYTGFDKFYGKKEYYEEHPCVDQEFCELLIRKNIKMLGMDIPSPDRYPFKIHKLLFKNKIFILENLTNLEQLLGVKSFEVFAFPLRIEADSSMTRAVARILKYRL